MAAVSVREVTSSVATVQDPLAFSVPPFTDQPVGILAIVTVTGEVPELGAVRPKLIVWLLMPADCFERTKSLELRGSVPDRTIFIAAESWLTLFDVLLT